MSQTIERTLPRRRAMSFMELMIVIVILGLLTMLSAPTLRNVFLVGTLRTSASDLASLVRLARQQAILRQHKTRIAIYPDQAAYEMIVDPDGVESGGPISSLKQSRDAMEGMRRLDPQKNTLSFMQVETAFDGFGSQPGARYIEFQRDGSATPATIVIVNEHGRHMTVRVAAATGAPRVMRELPENREPPAVEPPGWDQPPAEGGTP